MYRTLNAEKIVDTMCGIATRVGERFPQSGLSKVAIDLIDLSKDAARLSAALGRPNVAIRTVSILVACAFIILIAIAFRSIRVNLAPDSASDLAQGIESFINDIVFAGIAIWFLFSIETRIKRKRALNLMAELRSLAHVIDMHQFQKDPDRLTQTYQATPSSPKVELTPALLTRYLDYCSEMLGILSKLAALVVQDFDDAHTLAAVNEVEDLTSGLQRKIWQKIMIIDRVFDAPPAALPAAPAPQSAG